MPEFSNELALPMLGVMVLTLVVWIVMFVQRLGYATANKIDAEEMKTPAMVQALLPDEVSRASHNLKNLFEMPVLFYAICLALTVFGQVDSVHVYCAWAFLLFRVLHSAIACSYNAVMHRFITYLIASLALWVMVVRALLATL
ncbi:MAG: MAPEG family protein [Halieaceae bacterium]